MHNSELQLSKIGTNSAGNWHNRQSCKLCRWEIHYNCNLYKEGYCSYLSQIDSGCSRSMIHLLKVDKIICIACIKTCLNKHNNWKYIANKESMFHIGWCMNYHCKWGKFAELNMISSLVSSHYKQYMWRLDWRMDKEHNHSSIHCSLPVFMMSFDSLHIPLRRCCKNHSYFKQNSARRSHCKSGIEHQVSSKCSLELRRSMVSITLWKLHKIQWCRSNNVWSYRFDNM
jgi:hypothetical protein